MRRLAKVGLTGLCSLAAVVAWNVSGDAGHMHHRPVPFAAGFAPDPCCPPAPGVWGAGFAPTPAVGVGFAPAAPVGVTAGFAPTWAWRSGFAPPLGAHAGVPAAAFYPPAAQEALFGPVGIGAGVHAPLGPTTTLFGPTAPSLHGAPAFGQPTFADPGFGQPTFGQPADGFAAPQMFPSAPTFAPDACPPEFNGRTYPGGPQDFSPGVSPGPGFSPTPDGAPRTFQDEPPTNRPNNPGNSSDAFRFQRPAERETTVPVRPAPTTPPTEPASEGFDRGRGNELRLPPITDLDDKVTWQAVPERTRVNNRATQVLPVVDRQPADANSGWVPVSNSKVVRK